ncbi:MAG: hypothetical protein KC996_01395 [Phycisphaerales bacterium]|nr:hypothetical protein [Phycisphaerales bacterium]
MPNPTDDRGNPCSIAGLSAKQVGWRALGLPSVTPDPVLKEEQKRTAGIEIAVAIVGGLVGWVLWSIAVSPLTRPKLGVLLDLVAQTTWCVIVAMIFWYILLNRIRRERFPRIAEIYLSAGNCASCGYKLHGLAPEPDSCILCPECNAAWKQTRIGSQVES